MKPCLLLLLLCAGFITSFSQFNDSVANHQLYSNRAKTQQTAALILAGTGLVVTTYSTFHLFDNSLSSSNDAAVVGLLAGLGLELGGLTLALASSPNLKECQEVRTFCGNVNRQFLKRT